MNDISELMIYIWHFIIIHLCFIYFVCFRINAYLVWKTHKVSLLSPFSLSVYRVLCLRRDPGVGRRSGASASGRTASWVWSFRSWVEFPRRHRLNGATSRFPASVAVVQFHRHPSWLRKKRIRVLTSGHHSRCRALRHFLSDGQASRNAMDSEEAEKYIRMVNEHQ